MNQTKEQYDQIAIEAVTEAIQEVALANRLQLGEPAQIALGLFGKKVTDLVWKKLNEERN